jgi:hypothetical protein
MFFGGTNIKNCTSRKMEHHHICASGSVAWVPRTNRMASAKLQSYPVWFLFCKDGPNRKSTDQNQQDLMKRNNKFGIFSPVFPLLQGSETGNLLPWRFRGCARSSFWQRKAAVQYSIRKMERVRGWEVGCLNMPQGWGVIPASQRTQPVLIIQTKWLVL